MSARELRTEEGTPLWAPSSPKLRSVRAPREGRGRSVRYGNVLLPQSASAGARGLDGARAAACPCEGGGATPSPGPASQPGSARAVETFAEEMSACLQRLSELGQDESRCRAAAAESWASAPGQDRAPLPQVSSAQEGSARPRSSGVLGGGRVRSGTAPLEGFSELPSALEGVRARFHELVSALKAEQGHLWQENATLRRDGETHLQQLRALQEQRERDAAALGALRGDRDRLESALGGCRSELAQALQAVTDLEHCSERSYRRITQLEADGDRLRARLGRLRRAVSERAGACRGAAARLRRGHRELRALVSELGASHAALMRDLVAGIEGAMEAFREERALLGRKIRDLEREAESEGAHGSPAGQLLRGSSQTGQGAAGAADNRAPAAGAHGPLVVDGVDRTRGRPGPSSHAESCTAEPAEGRGAVLGRAGGAGARLEEEPVLGAADQGPAPWCPSAGPRVSGLRWAVRAARSGGAPRSGSCHKGENFNSLL